MSDEDDSAGDVLRLATGLSTERGRFLRRTCPSCGRDLKTEIDPAHLQWLIAPAIQRIGPEIGVSLTVSGGEPAVAEEYLYCPYCDARSEMAATLTEETVRFLRRILVREVVLPAVHGAFAPPTDPGRRSGSFVTVDYQRGVLPPRPMHGPEPPDMKTVEFLCCRKRAKVAEGCRRVRLCVYCGAAVHLV